MPVARYIAERRGTSLVSIKDIKVGITDPKKLRHLQHVISVKFSISLPEECTLVVANRYVEQEFVELARNYDFELAETYASKQYERYKILVLVKN